MPIQIVFNQSEITAGTRGASLGPDAIVTAARKAKDAFFSNYQPRVIPNFNAGLDGDFKFPKAKYIELLDLVMDEVMLAIDETYENDEFPFLVSADHGSAAGTIAAVKKEYQEERLGVVWIDAHGDLHTPFTTPTGNMHGMPLAVALHENNKESQINEVKDGAAEAWEKLKNKGTNEAKLKPEDLLFFGVRDTEKPENELMDRLGLVNHQVESWRAKSEQEKIEILDAYLSQIDVLYVSFDVDSMDPDLVSYGTGTPVKNGFSPEEAEWLLNYFAKQEKLVCMEFVEVNPCLDNKCNKMAETTFDLLKKTVQTIDQTLSA